MEDAALLRPQPGGPLAFTVDFITPIVDDPYDYGAIAAANSLSDVYAMGGTPQVALAVCGFPDDRVPRDVLVEIFRGGRDKAAEAGCAIAGGHTVLDPELKYGLCVLGNVADGRVLAQTGASPGDRLVLTKPIGSGVAAQALKTGALDPADLDAVVAAMKRLNADARDAAPVGIIRTPTPLPAPLLLVLPATPQVCQRPSCGRPSRSSVRSCTEQKWISIELGDSSTYVPGSFK